MDVPNEERSHNLVVVWNYFAAAAGRIKTFSSSTYHWRSTLTAQVIPFSLASDRRTSHVLFSGELNYYFTDKVRD